MFLRIQKVIDDSHLSLPVFARRLGVSRSALINYKTGKTVPRDRFLEKFCDEFAVNKKWLLTGEGPQYRDNETLKEKSSVMGPKSAINMTARILMDATFKTIQQIESIEFWEKERLAYRFLVGEVLPGSNWEEMGLEIRLLIIQCLCPLFIEATNDQLQVVKAVIDRWVEKTGAKPD